MADFVLSCCSTADLTKEHFQQRDISYICFHYALDGVDYPDDLGESMPFDKFYAAMANGAETRTSQVNISEFVDYFTPFLEQGKDILHVCLSSGLSGVSNSAENAARIVRERYPDRKIYIVDSLGASSGYGLLMDKLADLRDEGMSIDAVRDWAEAHKLELHHWFFSTDLTFYVKGGRISKVAGVFGGLLDICPLLNMDNLGRLIPRSKIRGKKRVMKEIVARMEEHAQGGLDYSGKCYIPNSILNPMTYLQSPYNGHADWYCTGTDPKATHPGLWGPEKTIFDPCPPGYKVPGPDLWGIPAGNNSITNGGAAADYDETGVSAKWDWNAYEDCGRRWKNTGDYYPMAGNIYYTDYISVSICNYTGGMAFYWTAQATPDATKSSAYFVNFNPNWCNYRLGEHDCSAQIRCIRE